MIKYLRERERGGEVYIYLVLLSVATAISFQAWRALFNNFAVEIVSASASQVGIIQSVRELPGFLALIVIYLLLVIKEFRLASLSVYLMAVGVFLTGILDSFYGLIVSTLLMSIGFHYFETTNSSLSLQHFSKKDAPFLMASIKKVSAIFAVITAAIVWWASDYISYKVIYLIFGGVTFIIAIYATLRYYPWNVKEVVQKKRMVWKKKYMNFYLLTFFSGARRQIFVVFAVFLMVKKFNVSAGEVALLYLLNNLINIFILPKIAFLIDRIGEKRTLTIEYLLLIPLFLAYAYATSAWMVKILFIIDNTIFYFSIAIKTYFQKIADKEDIAPTNAVSFTINHIAAIFIPALGGLLWMYNYRIPFILGSVIGLCSLILARRISIIVDES